MMDKTILVIEDSPTQALHLQGLLEESGAHVVVANDGRSGLQKAQAVLPDLIVLDFQMPGMDGLEVCSVLKSEPATNHIPVIMLTAHEEEDTVMSGLELGVADFIPKDVFADVVLLETLRQMGVIAA